MEKYQKLFIYVFSLIIVYYFITRIPVFPEQISAIPTKKIIKAIIGLAMGAGALWIYLKKDASSNSKVSKIKHWKRWM
ncbi:hypothetical protein QQ020_03800 [Fulvivirgaceae bacterium BMA12]|uniref:Group-specific protein n=1 Tax=Agaribacillus aureus TaxID=3051825 RepID=A0ABT8L0D4_9BACT|nr:hypothetical protein [Fulvivirgaceae bacterium BMA12]